MHVHYQRYYINYELREGTGSCVVKLRSQGRLSTRGGWPMGSACNPEFSLHDSHSFPQECHIALHSFIHSLYKHVFEDLLCIQCSVSIYSCGYPEEDTGSMRLLGI